MEYTNNNLVFENRSFEILPVLSHQINRRINVSHSTKKPLSLLVWGTTLLTRNLSKELQANANYCSRG